METAIEQQDPSPLQPARRAEVTTPREDEVTPPGAGAGATPLEEEPGTAAFLESALARAREGDRAAFEVLYRAHHRRVYALALRLTRDARRAEELTQEVFVRAWRALPAFRGDSRLGTWLHTITVRSHLRAARDRRRRETREISEGAIEAFAVAARRAMPHTRVDLERAVARLPAGAREVLVLHDIHGYKHREIAEMLGVAEGTAKAQLHRARKLVRGSFTERGRARGD